MLQDFDARWEDAALRKDLLDVGRALESEPSIIGVSAHLLGIGKKRFGLTDKDGAPFASG